jgi:hypothetical protein
MSLMRVRRSGWTAAVMSASLLALAAPAAASSGTAASTGAAASSGTTASSGEDPDQLARRFGVQLVPKGSADHLRAATKGQPDPFLSLLPDPSSVDMYSWKASLGARSAAREAKIQRSGVRSLAATTRLLVDEAEPDAAFGVNDTPATAQRIPAFGSGRRAAAAAEIRGTLAPLPTPTQFASPAEDNGSIPLAGDARLRTGRATQTTGVIGDGPHGSSGDKSGDSDFYAVHAAAGQKLIVDARANGSGLDTVVALWDAGGHVVALNDDRESGDLDSLLTVRVPAAGDYYVSVSGYYSLLRDPFDSGSGPGAESEGAYSVTFALDATDVDYYAVRLRPGDVLSGSVSGSAPRMTVYAPGSGGVQEVFGSSQDASAIYPLASPLTGGGNAVVDHVADVNGWHYVAVEGGFGDYDITLEVYRPGPEVKHARQTIFLDFDGARVNTGIWGGPGVRQLSPLSSFLSAWGIPASQQSALIDQIVATTTENLKRDFAGTGVKVRILNSRDNADTFGQSPDVSRIVVGGTIAESGISTIGIAQSIDPGNYDMAETALVLLDVLSAGPSQPASLNAYLKPESDRVRFVGTGIGNVVSHESGHLLGNWHVDQFDATANLMDQGGNFAVMFGVGPDGVGGTADDPDVDFGKDTLNPNEGFTGLENTWQRTRWGLTP